ncbi:DUF2789 domain-containing protein [Limnobacter humi]|uniref:DUF2789 domain-containing protein n=1 Tax=Limnobacter humi TaxID=1778671 RepID=A0ABT1WGV3_9BURK|nr:DUF2789 family protein [Limnobacter humi]MCQ8896762.1 DUF2789 domain-containing protein [Limnobacter humi]
MDSHHHSFTALFKHLGLDAEPDQIAEFLRMHSPLPEDIRVERAPFWSASQAAFLREGLEQDSEWAEMIDQLSAALRKPQ